MKHCASCGRDIPESATVCASCEAWAAEHVAGSPIAAQALRTVPPSPEPAPGPTVTPPDPAVSSAADSSAAPASAKRLGSRQLGLIFAGVAVIGVLVFTLLPSRAVPAARAAAPARAVVTPPREADNAAPPAATQVWSTQRRAYWTGNQRHSAAFELPAENTVPIWMSQVRPLLIVRCLSKKPEVFVFTGSALKIEPDTDDHTVSFRFDDEAATTVRWPDSAEHDALFSPDAAGFAQRLMRARTLRFGYTPHNAAAVEAHFEVSGLTGLIEPAAKDCGWKK